MKKTSKIYIAGHQGMVGSAIKQKLKQEGYENLVYRSSSKLHLCCQKAVQNFFSEEQPDIVIDDGKNGLLYDGNVDSLASKMEFLLENGHCYCKKCQRKGAK